MNQVFFTTTNCDLKTCFVSFNMKINYRLKLHPWIVTQEKQANTYIVEMAVAFHCVWRLF